MPWDCYSSIIALMSEPGNLLPYLSSCWRHFRRLSSISPAYNLTLARLPQRYATPSSLSCLGSLTHYLYWQIPRELSLVPQIHEASPQNPRNPEELWSNDYRWGFWKKAACAIVELLGSKKLGVWLKCQRSTSQGQENFLNRSSSLPGTQMAHWCWFKKSTSTYAESTTRMKGTGIGEWNGLLA